MVDVAIAAAKGAVVARGVGHGAGGIGDRNERGGGAYIAFEP